jgi:hypothetical protein
VTVYKVFIFDGVPPPYPGYRNVIKNAELPAFFVSCVRSNKDFRKEKFINVFLKFNDVQDGYSYFQIVSDRNMPSRPVPTAEFKSIRLARRYIDEVCLLNGVHDS